MLVCIVKIQIEIYNMEVVLENEIVRHRKHCYSMLNMS